MNQEQLTIVVLDGHTLNPGDLSWDRLEGLGQTTIYDQSGPDEVQERAKDAEIAITNKSLLPENVISALPKLQYIGVLATGYNVVDLDSAKERGIPVTNIPTYGTRSVAQMVFAHILNFTQHVAHHAGTVCDGRWACCPEFCYWDHPMVELDGLTMGIVGYGRIGQATGQLASAFGMKVLAHDAYPVEAPATTRMVDLETIFRESDFVSLHCPLTSENEKMVNPERLALMKPTAFLINTARGPLVDEAALAAALSTGQIAGAGLDVLTVEPPVADHPLYGLKNCVITPHIAWATRAARARLLNTAVDNLEAFLAGNPQNVVNP
jgi:glycerate dehydrogenase